ncbi:MAG: hypothetical protein ABS78_16085 [Phenylobacterium sp. SCN 70-31]|nr:MAG: hypothetical protein ABS78_16085 [Phenylobacterium sp. SCN 70-31]
MRHRPIRLGLSPLYDPRRATAVHHAAVLIEHHVGTLEQALAFYEYFLDFWMLEDLNDLVHRHDSGDTDVHSV